MGSGWGVVDGTGVILAVLGILVLLFFGRRAGGRRGNFSFPLLHTSQATILFCGFKANATLTKPLHRTSTPLLFNCFTMLSDFSSRRLPLRIHSVLRLGRSASGEISLILLFHSLSWANFSREASVEISSIWLPSGLPRISRTCKLTRLAKGDMSVILLPLRYKVINSVIEDNDDMSCT